ncbi:MAG: HPr(Ser) kinase/phosphatase [Polyangiaceae bacterium]
MKSDDDPPSRAAPSSSKNSTPGGQVSYDWPDDETFAGPAPSESPAKRPLMSARALLDETLHGLSLALLAGRAGLDRPIAHTRIQKSGLALAGHFHGIVPSRIQILGQTEQSFVDRLEPNARERALAGFFGLGLSCVVLTGELGRAAPKIIERADVTDTPLLHAPERSSLTITSLHALLDERLAPRKRLHGVLIDVFGVGLFLMGGSGVGKSECALELVMRGHRLVADDVVECDFRPPGMVFGAPAKLLRHHLEVRGLGILNIKDLFGVTAIRERKRVDVVVRLVDEASAEADFDRLGLDERFHTILGVSIPELVVPVRPGRDMASILEVAARNELLKNAGHHAARELFGAIETQIATGAPREPMLRLDASVPSSTVTPATARTPIAHDAEGERLPLRQAAAFTQRGSPLRPRESEFGMPAVRAPRTDESSAPPPVGPHQGRLGPLGGGRERK